MNKTIKRNVLVSAILAIMLCVSLIAGATFALFTSESKVNVAVTAGNVDVVASVEHLTLGTTLVKGNLEETKATQDQTNGNIITLDKIVPGDYVTFDIRIKNNSDVAVQYRTIIEKVSDAGLWAGLEVTFDEVKYEGTDAVKTEWKDMAVGSADIIVAVKVALPEEAGNEYKKTSCSFAYTVEAAQGNADMPSEWDGTTTTAPQKDSENVYHITNAAELAYAMEHSSPQMFGYQGNEYCFGNFVLERSIDFNGATVTGFAYDGNHFNGSFDGQGHTISNFVIDNSNQPLYGGLFGYLYGATIKNVIVKNANVKGSAQIGVVVGAASDYATITDCKVYNSTVNAAKKVGAVVGYSLNSTVTGCYAENCTVMYGEKEGGEVIGYINTGCTTENNTYLNVNVIQGTSVSTNEALSSALTSGGNVYLTENASIGSQTTVSADTTINLGGKTLQLNNGLKLSGDADLTISGGTVSVNNDLRYIDVRPGDAEGGVVTFENVVFENTYKKATQYGPATDYTEKLVDLWVSSDDSNVEFKFVGCTFINAQVAFRGAAGTSGKFSATFENCEFQNFGVDTAIEVQNYLEGTVTIKDCTFNLTSTGTQNVVDCGNSQIALVFEGNVAVNGYAATPSADIKVNTANNNTIKVKVYTINATNGSTVSGLDNVTVSGIATKD